MVADVPGGGVGVPGGPGGGDDVPGGPGAGADVPQLLGVVAVLPFFRRILSLTLSHGALFLEGGGIGDSCLVEEEISN